MTNFVKNSANIQEMESEINEINETDWNQWNLSVVMHRNDEISFSTCGFNSMDLKLCIACVS